MAALIVVSTTLGPRRRYAVEMVVGIALGIGIADALVVLIGGATLQIAAIVAGAMVAAVALGGSVGPGVGGGRVGVARGHHPTAE